jgi:RHS repeat-associated protein
MRALIENKIKWRIAANVLLGLMFSGAVRAGTITNTQSYEYDATTGLLTAVIREPDTPQLHLKTTYTYDKYGNRLSTEVSSQATGTAAIATRKTSIVEYDSLGFAPTSFTNALGQKLTTSIDPSNQPLYVQALNGLTTKWEYDSFGRKTLETRPDGTRTTYSYVYCTSPGTIVCAPTAKYVATATPIHPNLGKAIGAWVRTHYDLQLRVVRTETQGFDGVSVIRQDTEYDIYGHVARKSRPYFSADTPKWITFAYDSLGRKISTTAPDDSIVSISYSGLQVTITNELSQSQIQLKDSQGQVVKVTDADSNSLTYQYDANGNLTQTTDPSGNSIAIAYDDLGRKTSMNDPDLGTISYVFDALGQLRQQTSAKGDITDITYDLLGRMTKRTEPDLTSTWVYDSCTMGKGQLCSSASNNGYSKTISYDSYARPSQSTAIIDGGGAFTTSYTYGTIDGRIASQTYPSGFSHNYIYTALGYLKQLKDSASNTYWLANAMDASGNFLQQTYGSVVVKQTFDDDTGRVLSITAGDNKEIQNLKFSYDAHGNMLTRSDVNLSLSEAFTYDTLNRLTGNTVTGSAGAVPAQTYAYDAIGNITSRSDVGTYTYAATGAGPHAVTEIALANGGKRQFTYDLNGNLIREAQQDSGGNTLTGKARTETYSSFNMPTKISVAGGDLNFFYGPDHQRFKQISATGTTIYVHPDNAGGMIYEKEIKASGAIEQRAYLTAGGGVFTVVKQDASGQTVQKFFRDNLGSTTVLASGATVLERFSYEPFGKRRTLTGALDTNNAVVGVTTNRGFTNHEELDTVGLIHMNGRVYDPAIGRFISGDPSVPYTTNIQSYNRYSYTRNNPMIAVDPSGFTDFYTSDPYESSFIGSFNSPSIFSPWIPNTLPPVTSRPQITPGCVLVVPIGFRAASCMPIAPPVISPVVIPPVSEWRIPAVYSQQVINALLTVYGTAAKARDCVLSLSCIDGIIARASSVFASDGTDSGKSDEANKEITPTTDPDNFDSVRGTRGRRDKDTGEIWEKDKLHNDHYEVYKNKKDYDKGKRDRDVWEDGRPKRQF